jgi:hypothetical protein
MWFKFTKFLIGVYKIQTQFYKPQITFYEPPIFIWAVKYIDLNPIKFTNSVFYVFRWRSGSKTTATRWSGRCARTRWSTTTGSTTQGSGTRRMVAVETTWMTTATAAEAVVEAVPAGPWMGTGPSTGAPRRVRVQTPAGQIRPRPRWGLSPIILKNEYFWLKYRQKI